MQNEEWNVSAVSLSPELVRLAQQKQARFEACLQAAENGNEAAITEPGARHRARPARGLRPSCRLSWQRVASSRRAV